MTQASDVLDLIETLRRKGSDFCVATVVRTADLTSAKAGAKAVVTPDGEIHGFVGGGCVTGAVRRAATEAMRTGRPEMIRVRPRDEVTSDEDSDGAPLYKSSCPSGGTVEIFLEPLKSARRLLVIGTSPVAEALLKIAEAAGFATIQAGIARDADRFDGTGSHIDGFDLAAAELRAEDSIVIATQGRGDGKALRAALASPAAYVSMIGSHRKIAALKADLADETDLSPERIARLRGPAGFDIGAVGPEEIALSVVTEVVAFLRRPDAVSTPQKNLIRAR